MFRVVNRIRSCFGIEYLRKPLEEADPEVYQLILA